MFRRDPASRNGELLAIGRIRANSCNFGENYGLFPPLALLPGRSMWSNRDPNADGRIGVTKTRSTVPRFPVQYPVIYPVGYGSGGLVSA